MDGARRFRCRSSRTCAWSPGPAMLRDENGMLTGYVYVDVAGRDVGSYVDEAKHLVRKSVNAAGRVFDRLERPV